MTVTEWSIREEILAISHRWHLPMIAFLIGSLIGWGTSFLFPTPYRAELQLYVAYNADDVYRNPDDYKNWQMRQISDLATSDFILSETLDRLKASNPYWQDRSVNDLRGMVKILWRNAGKWHLSVEHRQAKISVQVVQTWSQVLIEEYEQAMKHAADQYPIDKQLQATANSLAEAQLYAANLVEAREKITSWRKTIGELPEGSALDDVNRWTAWSILTQPSEFNPAWQSMLDGYPDRSSPREAYLAWADQALFLIENDLQAVTERIASLEQEQNALTQQYQDAIDGSHGLSAKLEVGREYYAPIEAEPVRPTALTTLVGGMLGILTWSILWLGHPIYQAKK
jgi:hypothetical protein